MKEQVVIDNLEFAASAGTLRGIITKENLSRIPELIEVAKDGIAYSLIGRRSADGKPILVLTISGKLHLKCQRCLEELVHKLNINTTLEITGPRSTETDELNEGLDQITAQLNMDVLTLVEDEIWVSLPFSPRHEIGECDLKKF